MTTVTDKLETEWKCDGCSRYNYRDVHEKRAF
jgi:hypothetical protein